MYVPDCYRGDPPDAKPCTKVVGLGLEMLDAQPGALHFTFVDPRRTAVAQIVVQAVRMMDAFTVQHRHLRDLIVFNVGCIDLAGRYLIPSAS